MQSSANTVDAYLAELPPERRAVLDAVRAVVVANLPEGYAESMTWGMPTYEVPLARYPDTDMGKSCVRFISLDDADLPLIGETVAAMPVDQFIAMYERARDR